MIGFTVFILGLFAILFICEIATKVDTSLKVKKLDRQSQQSYKKREQELIEKELLSSLINREIDAQNSLDRSVERFRSLPPDVQEKILQRIGRRKYLKQLVLQLDKLFFNLPTGVKRSKFKITFTA